MLKATRPKGIRTEEKTVRIEPGAELYVKILAGENPVGKTALFIHGGGSGGNHTIVLRPSYRLMERGTFSRMILPDRRGAGLSSPMTRTMTFMDNALDMKNLLDGIGEKGKLTAIGISYGGPVALTLAAIDPRVEDVILVASSPSLRTVKGLWGWMYRHNLITPVVRAVYGKVVGTKPPAYPDFDSAYDAGNEAEMKRLFIEKLRCIPAERLASLMFENDSTCDLDNRGIDPGIRLEKPVYRVIGTKDEIWETTVGRDYVDSLPFLKTAYVNGASHKDVFFRADEFYDALCGLLETDEPETGAAVRDGRTA